MAARCGMTHCLLSGCVAPDNCVEHEEESMATLKVTATGIGEFKVLYEPDGGYRDDSDERECMAMFERAPQMASALKVIVLDAKIRAYLEAHDPMALRQARRALGMGEIEIPTYGA